MLEASHYDPDCCNLVTLTYNPDHLPRGGTLVPAHLSGWLKRVRQHLVRSGAPPLRYYAVGEYGSQTLRPHYHVAAFGPPRRAVVSAADRAWVDSAGAAMGRIHPGYGWSANAAQYVAQYVTKKWTAGSRVLPAGLEPEFSRQSRRPGIGLYALDALEAAWRKTPALRGPGEDVPTTVRIQGRLWPLGQTAVRQLRARCFGDAHTPPYVLALRRARQGREERNYVASMDGQEVELLHPNRLRERLAQKAVQVVERAKRAPTRRVL